MLLYELRTSGGTAPALKTLLSLTYYTPNMSIFSSKKQKPREIDVSKPQPANGNAAKPQQPRQVPKNGPASSFSNAALSAGARTIQRAQIMAASRRRMNGETPDYSIEGAAKTSNKKHRASAPSDVSVSAARQAVQGAKSNGTADVKSKGTSSPQQKSSKEKRQSKDEKQSRANTMNTVGQPANMTPMKATAQPPNGAGSLGTASPPYVTPPMLQDSPTLGHDGFSNLPPKSNSVSAPTAVPVTTAGQAQAGATPQEIRVGRISRNDSGLDSKPGSSRDLMAESKSGRSSANGSKPSSVPPGVRAEEKSNRSSISSNYISRLDPGPSGSIFAASVESPTTMTAPAAPANDDDTGKRPRQTSRPQKFQLPETEVRKGRSSSGADKAPQPVQSPAGSFRGLNKIVAASQASSQMHSSAPQPRKEVPRKEVAPFAQSPRSSSPADSKSRGIDAQSDAASRTYTLPTSPPADGFRTAPTSKPNSPPRSRDSKHCKVESTGSQPKSAKSLTSASFVSQPGASQATQPFPPLSSTVPSDAPRSSISEMRPPISVLEGFKVNKRGHVLDEEGEVIGELFEGDLIDCVRQKCDANGDVLDESGTAVGRVRTVIKGTVLAPRWSISSATGGGLPLSNYNWARRNSNASQATYQTQLTQQSSAPAATFFNRMGASKVTTPAVEGNAFVAELDASTEVEAGPVIDHSEIFSPFGAAPRAESPSEMSNDERSNSDASKTEARRESVAEPPPKPVRKWTSRYFENNPLEGGQMPVSQPPSRRNSTANNTTVQSPKSTTSIYGAVSQTRGRAVIGPTLESLLEQDPSLLTPQPVARHGASTPNLHETPKNSGSQTPRPKSTQFGAPAPGLGSRLSVKSGYGNHQPIRRSPLGNYETTPPGTASGTGNLGVDDGTPRARSQPPPNRMGHKKGKRSVDTEDAAPAPGISLTKLQERRLNLIAGSGEKVVGKRKSSVFGFLRGRESAAA